METGFRNVVILILSLVSSYLLPIAISCTVYIALLVVKKRIGQNKINVVEQANLEPHDSSDGPTFYAVQMQQNETSERNNQPTSKEDVSNVLNDADADDILRVQAEERRQAEIRAATRSIETNLVLVVIFVVVYGAFIFMSGKVRQSYSLFAFSTLKGLLPICTTIANFGTVHSVMIQYCQYFKSKFCRHDLE